MSISVYYLYSWSVCIIKGREEGFGTLVTVFALHKIVFSGAKYPVMEQVKHWATDLMLSNEPQAGYITQGSVLR